MLDVPVTNYQPKKTEGEGEAKRPVSRKGWHHSYTEVLGKNSILLTGGKAQKIKLYKDRITIMCEF